MLTLTEEQAELFREPNFAVATTLKADGTPQTSVVWVDEEGGRPVFNTTKARAKGRHLRRDPRVSVLVWQRSDPYRYIEVEGIAELDEDGAIAHIHKLSHKYRGTDFPPPEDRLIVPHQPQPHSRLPRWTATRRPFQGHIDVEKRSTSS